MTNDTPTPTKSAIASAVKANDVVMIADSDHTDDTISKRISAELPAMQQAGLKHLYLEHDAAELTLEALRQNSDAYGDMINKAESLGITIHLYDERSILREIDKKFPEEAAQVHAVDPYLMNSKETVAHAKNPKKMHAYYEQRREEIFDHMDHRNTAMATNLDHDLKKYSDAKSAVFIGQAHLMTAQDVDESLRANGHHVTTVAIYSSPTALQKIRADIPDIIIHAETGSPIAYKDPSTEAIQRAMEGVELPWKNTQSVLECSTQTSLSDSATPHVSTSREGNYR